MLKVLYAPVWTCPYKTLIMYNDCGLMKVCRAAEVMMASWNTPTGKQNCPSKSGDSKPWRDLLNICTNYLAEEAVPPKACCSEWLAKW